MRCQVQSYIRDPDCNKKVTQIEKSDFESNFKHEEVQSGASSLAKHGGAYFSAVCRSIQDPITALGPYENQEP